jgi:hypothetical protein
MLISVHKAYHTATRPLLPLLLHVPLDLGEVRDNVMRSVVCTGDWRRHKFPSSSLVNTAINADDIELVMVLQDTDIPVRRAMSALQTALSPE